MKKLFITLRKCLKDNFTLDELKKFDRMLKSGEGLNIFQDSLSSAIASKEHDIIQDEIMSKVD